jgi:hypothetical protein
MKLIYNFQIVQIAERSNKVEIADEEIQALKDWKENPYKGTTNQDLVKYIATFQYTFPSPETAPDFAQHLYDQLFGDEKEKTECWNSLEKSSDSKLILEDNDGNSLAEAESSM